MTTSNYDINAAFAPIAKRLQSIEGVKAVRGGKDLANVLNNPTTGSDGYVYLVFDGIATGGTAGSNQKQGSYRLITVSYGVIVSSQSYADGGMPSNTGILMGRIMAALAGFSPLDDDPRSRQTLTQTDAGSPIHSYGHSLYPMKFNLDVIITGENNE